jgi:hypothetical protein
MPARLLPPTEPAAGAQAAARFAAHIRGKHFVVPALRPGPALVLRLLQRRTGRRAGADLDTEQDAAAAGLTTRAQPQRQQLVLQQAQPQPDSTRPAPAHQARLLVQRKALAGTGRLQAVAPALGSALTPPLTAARRSLQPVLQPSSPSAGALPAPAPGAMPLLQRRASAQGLAAQTPAHAGLAGLGAAPALASSHSPGGQAARSALQRATPGDALLAPGRAVLPAAPVLAPRAGAGAAPAQPVAAPAPIPTPEARPVAAAAAVRPLAAAGRSVLVQRKPMVTAAGPTGAGRLGGRPGLQPVAAPAFTATTPSAFTAAASTPVAMPPALLLSALLPGNATAAQAAWVPVQPAPRLAQVQGLHQPAPASGSSAMPQPEPPLPRSGLLARRQPLGQAALAASRAAQRTVARTAPALALPAQAAPTTLQGGRAFPAAFQVAPDLPPAALQPATRLQVPPLAYAAGAQQVVQPGASARPLTLDLSLRRAPPAPEARPADVPASPAAPAAPVALPVLTAHPGERADAADAAPQGPALQALAERVFGILERRLVVERERRGIRS